MAVTQITVGSVTDRGLHPKRKANEDRLLALPGSGLFLVADGVGGRQAGQVASQTAVDVFSEAFAARPGRDVLDLLKQAIAQSNRRVYENSMNDPSLEGMATTLAVVAVDGARVIIGHVGDSRVYRFDGQRLTCETDDHSEVAEGLRTGELSATTAKHANRNVITRALGIEPEVEADFNIIALNERTSLLLCSDGITRHIPDRELEEVLKSGAHPQSICDRLKEICYARGAEDNLTAVVVDFGEREYQEEQTRPRTVAKAGGITASLKAKPATKNAVNDAAVSRISVAFEYEPEAAQPSARTSARARPSGRAMTQRPNSSLVNNLFQLLILLFLLAGAFLIGRYYDQLYTLVWGQAPSAVKSQATNHDAPPDQPQSGPDLASARALFEEKRFEKARDGFAGLVSKEPANAEYRYWLGRAQLETKQYQDAVKNLTEAARANDKLPGVFLHLALAYDGLNDRKGVSENLRHAATQ